MTYGRFYSLFNLLPVHTDSMKEDFVLQYTNGRTRSLKEMSQHEYNAMCSALESSIKDKRTADHEELKRHRSGALKLMQELGIDTTDWTRINAFCQDIRIAGRPFRELMTADLQVLKVKLRGIQRAGGLKPLQGPEPTTGHRIYVSNLHGNNEIVN